MDSGRNYFATDTMIGVKRGTTPNFEPAVMHPFYQVDSMYSSPEAYAKEGDDYMTRGPSYSWPSTEAAQASMASPVTPISGFSSAPVTFEQAETYAQWSVGEWQPSFQHEEELSLSSGSDPIPPPAKKQRTKPGHRTSKDSSRPAATAAAVSAVHLPPSPPNPPPPPPLLPPSISNPETPPSPPTSPPDRGVGQLRTASRKAKRTSAHKPAASEEERRARASHNLVEKQYRNRLNTQFEKLLAVLPAPGSDDDGGSGDRRLSKAEVLDIARRRIKALERERDTLKVQKKELTVNVGGMREAIMRQRRADD